MAEGLLKKKPNRAGWFLPAITTIRARATTNREANIMTEKASHKEGAQIKLQLQDAAQERADCRLLKPLKIYIRYMVSLRCMGAAERELEKLNIKFNIVDFGHLEVSHRIPAMVEKKLNANLKRAGMELLSREKSAGLENIICAVDALMANPGLGASKGEIKFIQDKSKLEPGEVLNLFAEVKGISVHQYLLKQKIETAKVWLLYSDISIHELAYHLNFKNPRHLALEFKKFTGTPPTFYRKIKNIRTRNAKTAGQEGIHPPPTAPAK